MKALDVIEVFDKIRPNSFEHKTKLGWVISVETDIRRFASLHGETVCDMSFVGEENPGLFLDAPSIDIYVYYLVSMADMANAEYRLYTISSTYFNGLFDRWKRIYRTTHKPQTNICIKI